MDAAECRERFAAAPVAVLATAGEARPHLVPIVFALTGQDTIVTAVDHKPKTTRDLQRLANIRRTPAVALLAHEYDEDWSRLWWVRADGTATVVDEPHPDTVAALQRRYPQYVDHPPAGPVIEIEVTRWVGWSAS